MKSLCANLENLLSKKYAAASNGRISMIPLFLLWCCVYFRSMKHLTCVSVCSTNDSILDLAADPGSRSVGIAQVVRANRLLLKMFLQKRRTKTSQSPLKQEEYAPITDAKWRAQWSFASTQHEKKPQARTHSSTCWSWSSPLHQRAICRSTSDALDAACRRPDAFRVECFINGVEDVGTLH